MSYLLAMLPFETFHACWSGPDVTANILLLLNLVGVLLLGLLIGYERFYRDGSHARN
jgi:putative Mg2+ transporter-C (MgtC) family protein